MKVITRALELIPEYDLRSICKIQEMLLFDIETTGLRKETTQVYLIGCVYYEAGTWYVRQWLTENVSDERLVLEDFLQFSSSYRLLLHFNGDSFDIPYLQYKAQFYQTETDLSGMDSFDIYQHARKARKLLGLKSMSQRSLEEYLGIFREDQLNGGLLIPVYYDYEKTGASESEHLLLLHNYDDLQGMIRILPVLAYGQVFEGAYQFRGLEECREEVILNYQLQAPVPKGISACLQFHQPEDIRIRLDQDLLQIRIRCYEGSGRIPLENVSDYYYLVEEDRVIHKDVAQFVDRSKRVKATRKNCFLRKDGSFFPQLEPRILPAYYLNTDKKQIYADREQFLAMEEPFWQQTAKDIFQRISSC